MPHVGQAFDWFNNNFDVFKHLNLKSMLYVGWTTSTKNWWCTTFPDALGIEKIGLIDIFSPNLEKSKKDHTVSQRVSEYILGNVCELDSILEKGKYDLIFWDHGPEHAPEDGITESLNHLKEYAGKCVITACPWGHFPQGKIGGNEWEIHRFDVLPEHFAPAGYQVVTINTINNTSPCGELIAYYIKE